MKSRGFVMQTFQSDHDALLLLVYIPETWRNLSLNNKQLTMQLFHCFIKNQLLSALKNCCQAENERNGNCPEAAGSNSN